MRIQITDLTIENLRDRKFIQEIPEFYQLRNVVENFPPWHYHESVFDHTLAVLEQESLILQQIPDALRNYLRQKPFLQYSRQDLLHLSIVFHDIGKLETFVQTGEVTSCSGHEEKGAEITTRILQREFLLNSKEIKRVAEMIQHHGNFCAFSRRQNTFQEYEKLKKQFPKVFSEMILLELADTQTLPNSNEKSWMINVYKELLRNC